MLPEKCGQQARLLQFSPEYSVFRSEFKKSVRGKTLMKNFPNTLAVLVTTIPAQTQAGMIDYTFLLPGKNDICKAR